MKKIEAIIRKEKLVLPNVMKGAIDNAERQAYLVLPKRTVFKIMPQTENDPQHNQPRLGPFTCPES